MLKHKLWQQPKLHPNLNVLQQAHLLQQVSSCKGGAQGIHPISNSFSNAQKDPRNIKKLGCPFWLRIRVIPVLSNRSSQSSTLSCISPSTQFRFLDSSTGSWLGTLKLNFADLPKSAPRHPKPIPITPKIIMAPSRCISHCLSTPPSSTCRRSQCLSGKLVKSTSFPMLLHRVCRVW